jgi:hypothetical protein
MEMLVAQELQPNKIKFQGFQTKIIQPYNYDSKFKSLFDDYWLSSTLLKKSRNNLE